MKLSFLSIPKITGSLKKLFFGDKPKIKSFLLLCLAPVSYTHLTLPTILRV